MTLPTIIHTLISFALTANIIHTTTTPNLSKISESEKIYQMIVDDAPLVPSKEIFELAMNGWEKLENNLENPVLTIIDFSLPSTEKRLWVIDMEKSEILINTVVSHGRNSGQLMAESFSNKPESYKSSLGFFKTAETYFGKHGYSLRIDGLEKGINDQARNRAIVIHGADYAKEEFAKATGRLGRSLGCPALPPDISKEAIDIIKEGSLMFVFGKAPDYLENSELAQP
ncbi:L,D-transpeptidase catalytic domain [Algoriphagus ornithinivorans]|uniref:L,D-transpeptidase catalytic domain n=1 Tax=Algoriphagus ornithinivorans TaxID=226506 RepID=A0A1I5H4X6_9BACT|nr:murein L,D-transpeptidase catalytic domain family protein [Algoriphagus ornithinivorans]SFO42891.1 L,D-transpeptidase catalytic domain [Algoriphagus ornithinivorans]